MPHNKSLRDKLEFQHDNRKLYSFCGIALGALITLSSVGYYYLGKPKKPQLVSKVEAITAELNTSNDAAQLPLAEQVRLLSLYAEGRRLVSLPEFARENQAYVRSSLLRILEGGAVGLLGFAIMGASAYMLKRKVLDESEQAVDEKIQALGSYTSELPFEKRDDATGW